MRSAAREVDTGDHAAHEPREKPRWRWRVGVSAVVVLLVAAMVVGVVVTLLAPRSTMRAVKSSASTNPPSSREIAGGGNPRAAIFVHVTGAVASPGLYELSESARVVDAIAAAGGFTTEADRSGVNLARRVADGEQLHAPAVGESPSAGTATAPLPFGSGGSSVVNLNSASTAELETLPRVGPAMATRIVEWREKNGPFQAVDDLLEVSGIGEKTLEGLRDSVTV